MKDFHTRKEGSSIESDDPTTRASCSNHSMREREKKRERERERVEQQPGTKTN
jgi:hypothetical protein